MQYGAITVELNHVPVEIGILVEGQQQSGAFIANRERRGIRIANEMHQIDVTADDALLLLAWLQEQAPALRAMLDEEAAALTAMEQRLAQLEPDLQPKPSQAEGDRATIEESLREKEV
jgi:ABC-type transporter Mla subunit MlaD